MRPHVLARSGTAASKALERRGVAFEEHLGEVPGIARYASFADPDGNSMQLIEYVPGED